jgi:hypothetical protein
MRSIFLSSFWLISGFDVPESFRRIDQHSPSGRLFDETWHAFHIRDAHPARTIDHPIGPRQICSVIASALQLLPVSAISAESRAG